MNQLQLLDLVILPRAVQTQFAKRKIMLVRVLVFPNIMAIPTNIASQNVLKILIVINQKHVSIKNVVTPAPEFADSMLNAL